MEVNHKLLDDVLFHIKQHPEEWYQPSYFERTDCGTAACFAGTACLMTGWEPFFESVNYRTTPFVKRGRGIYTAADAATLELGIDWATAGHLFSAFNSLERLEKLVALIHEKGSIDNADYEEIRKATPPHPTV